MRIRSIDTGRRTLVKVSAVVTAAAILAWMAVPPARLSTAVPSGSNCDWSYLALTADTVQTEWAQSGVNGRGSRVPSCCVSFVFSDTRFAPVDQSGPYALSNANRPGDTAINRFPRKAELRL